jgi:hypothetical protein
MSLRTTVLVTVLLLSSTAACSDDEPTTPGTTSSSSSGSSTSSSSSSGGNASGLTCLDNESSPQWCKRFDPLPANFRPNCAKEVAACPSTKVVAKCTRAENPGSTTVLYDQDFYILPETVKALIKKSCEDAKGTFTETP